MPPIQGLAVHAAGAELLSYKYEPGELEPGEIEITISHCGICHSDVHLIDNDWGISQYPFIPGHEIIGTVAAIGSDVSLLKLDQRVGVGWQAGCCGTCEWCQRGEEQLCPKIQPTCVGRNGGYADRVRVPEHFAVPIPDALESESAAPLLCAGVTAYAALKNYGVTKDSRVAIVGIGGVGHLAIQFARAFGAEISAFSTTPEKEEETRSFGAHHFINTRDPAAIKKLSSSFDFIVSTISPTQDWNPYIQALRPRGSLVFIGMQQKPATISLLPFINGQRSISGNFSASPKDMREMLDFAAQHNIKAQTEIFPMAQANEAISRLKKNLVRYRAVLAN
jgi:uncharacterized zinc-type alcohol dehydrogenase-like protein